MQKPIVIFMEYKVKEESTETYLTEMKKVIEEMEALETGSVEWYEAADQKGLYVEMVEVSSMKEYEYIKERRRDPADAAFGGLLPLLEKGTAGMNCWAFSRLNKK
ncbi:hypothetical protein [Sinobaca sp. H24]|uniref:hypothetical protein n=1 Tax=Sinobaca sp. H24 TaxID=2923376 RepID=UPI00207A1FF4|nr:hypothetical protein [Sinobaca sp. H24]